MTSSTSTALPGDFLTIDRDLLLPPRSKAPISGYLLCRYLRDGKFMSEAAARAEGDRPAANNQ